NTTLLLVLQDYDITRKLGSVIGDNASSNDTLCRIIDNHLLEKEEISWNSSLRRVPCLGHIINLAVNAFLFRDSKDLESLEQEEKDNNILESLGPLNKLRNMVVFIRGSASRTQEFKKLAGRRIPLYNRTRWNSWYLMLSVALEKATEIDSYTKTNFRILAKDFLSPEDWAWLQSVKLFLEPFYRAALETQGDNATIDNRQSLIYNAYFDPMS
ncbi:Ribonuclease H-like domain containing protein, partial [Rhypophila sp. PSN 637]